MELERARWVRRRFLWMVGVSLALSVPSLPLLWLSIPDESSRLYGSRDAHLVRTMWATLSVALYVLATVVVLVRRKTVATARFTSMLALALITSIAALSVPIERFAAGLEGTFSLEELSREQRSSATQPNPADPISAFRSGFEAGLRSGRQDGRVPSSIPSHRDTATTAPTETDETNVRRVELRPGVVFQLGDGQPGSTGAATTTASTLPAGAAVARPPRGPSNPNSWESQLFRSVLTPGVRTALYGVYIVLATHLISCIFMPWTVRESLVPGVAALGGYSTVLGADLIAGQIGFVFALSTLGLVAMMLVPGTTLCWWRYSRFRGEYRLKFESGKYKELRGELASARRIHESCLPAPLATGPVRVHYSYRPMSDIGGDLLVCRKVSAQPDSPVLVAIIDVTGHGIAAALTVNRLLGELERVIGTTRDPQPGAVLAALNAYTRLMLAHHNLYLSACVIRLEPLTRTVRFASGGHPTVYRVRAGKAPGIGDNPPNDLESTATLLGVLPMEEFDPGEISVTLSEGEVLVACTDGATETRLHSGDLLRTAGLRAIVEQVAGSEGASLEQMPEAVMRRLDFIRPGEAEDDTLLVTIAFA